MAYIHLTKDSTEEDIANEYIKAGKDPILNADNINTLKRCLEMFPGVAFKVNMGLRRMLYDNESFQGLKVK